MILVKGARSADLLFAFFLSCILSFVRPRRRLSSAPTARDPKPTRATAVKDGASSAPPEACPYMGHHESRPGFRARATFISSFLRVSLFGLRSPRFFVPAHLI